MNTNVTGSEHLYELRTQDKSWALAAATELRLKREHEAAFDAVLMSTAALLSLAIDRLCNVNLQ